MRMVQLPSDPATNSHVPTANEISSGTPPLSSGHSQPSAAGVGNPASDHQNASGGGIGNIGIGGGGMDAGGGSAGSGGSMPFTISSSNPVAELRPASASARLSRRRDSGAVAVTAAETTTVAVGLSVWFIHYLSAVVDQGPPTRMEMSFFLNLLYVCLFIFVSAYS